MNQRYWNLGIAFLIVVVFLVLAVVSRITSETFVAVLFAVAGMVLGTAVSLAGSQRLGTERFPQPTVEQVSVLILFIVGLVAALFGILGEDRFLELSLALLTYTLGRS